MLPNNTYTWSRMPTTASVITVCCRIKKIKKNKKKMHAKEKQNRAKDAHLSCVRLDILLLVQG